MQEENSLTALSGSHLLNITPTAPPEAPSPPVEKAVALSGSLSSPHPLPPNAGSILLQCMETQRQLRATAVAREGQLMQEEEAKHWRLAMLRRQQRRREELNRIDGEAMARMGVMLEELVAAVRDREVALRPDGYHAFVFPNEDVYEGSWKNCRMHGKGCLRQAETRSLYEGQWFLGQRCGLGTFRSAQVDTLYSGAWLDNKRHGRGELVEPEGVYTGEFVDNHINGFGEYVYKDGHVYRGEWRDGLYQGSGTYFYPSGGKYEGDWRAGCESGVGTRLFSNGDVYAGEWFEGRPHGRGIYTSAEFTAIRGRHHPGNDGGRQLQKPPSQRGPATRSYGQRDVGPVAKQRAFRFEGQWVHGTVQGDGTCVFADGTVCSGQWQNGAPHGQGVLQFQPAHPGRTISTTTTGSGGEWSSLAQAGYCCYSGEFQHGKRDGYGVFASPLAQYAGQWQDDRKHGHGAIKIRGAGTYEGGWCSDAPDGCGIYIADSEPLQHPFFTTPTTQLAPQHRKKEKADDISASTERGELTGDVLPFAHGDDGAVARQRKGSDGASQPQGDESGEDRGDRPAYLVECDQGICVSLAKVSHASAAGRVVAETGLNLRLQADTL